MKKTTVLSLIGLIGLVLGAQIVAGCEGPPVNGDSAKAPDTSKFSPSHQAMVDQRKADLDGK